MFGKFHLSLLWLVLGIMFSSGQEIRTLNQLLERAFAHDIHLVIFSHQQQFRQLELEKSRNLRLPQVQMSAGYNRIGKITSFSMPTGPNGEPKTFQFGNPSRIALDLRFSMPLYTSGRISSTITMNRNFLRLSNLQLQSVKHQITEQVLRLYFSFALNDAVLNIRREDLQRADENLMIAAERYKNGNVPELHVIRAQAEREKVLMDLEQVEMNRRNTLIAISHLTGVDTSRMGLQPILKMVDFASREEILRTKIFDRNSKLEEIEIQLLNVRESRGIARSARLPQLLAVGGYNVVNGFDPLKPEKFVDNWNVGVQLSIPLFDGFQSRLDEQQATINERKLKDQREAILREYRLKYEQKMNQIRQACSDLTHLNQIIHANQKAYQVAEKQYEQGYLSQLDLIGARFQFTQSQLLRQQALFNYLMHVLDICVLAEDFTLFSDYDQ